ncbi:hypothetical protein ACFLXB_08925 [Chloroflexota bacterium]
MRFSFPDNAKDIGFITDGFGSHGGRTIMLSELKLLFSVTNRTSTIDEYKRRIIEDNVLLKQTHSTRMESVRRLRELYGINSQLITFRALRDLWDHSLEAQPVLAMLAALGRDPVLRSTGPFIISLQTGNPVDAHMLSDVVKEVYGNLNPTTLAGIGRHISSSWTQSGHLEGRNNKVRVQVNAYPSSCAYALFLGYLCGERGEGLFHTPWAQILDTSVYALHNLAKAASQYGWLEYRQSGSITDISFHYLLRDQEGT